MALVRQTITLSVKTFLLIAVRSWLSTAIRALVFPILVTFLVSYTKYWSVPGGMYGTGPPFPLRSFQDALIEGRSARPDFVILDNGFRTGDIAAVVGNLSSEVINAGYNLHLLPSRNDINSACPADLGGSTSCFAAVDFQSSPNHGDGPGWNYSMTFDDSLGGIDVDSNSMGQDIYVLPLQHYIDSLIASITPTATPLPQTQRSLAFTHQTNQERIDRAVQRYEDLLANYFSIIFFVALCGVSYQLVGLMASERESGMSHLIEAMSQRRWETQIARVLSYHIVFDLIYLPGWIASGALAGAIIFPEYSVGIFIGIYILTGLAVTSMSIFAGMFFRKAQMSGIIVILISIILGIAAQFGFSTPGATGGVYAMSFLFPPAAFVFFVTGVGKFQIAHLPYNLSEVLPISIIPWRARGDVFFIFLAVQTIYLPFAALLVERLVHFTPRRGRKVTRADSESPIAIRLEAFTKHYFPTSWARTIFCCGLRHRPAVKAVTDLNLELYRGAITCLLGANGSGKSSTLNAIAGTDSVTAGSIELELPRGLGICPQRNVVWDNLTVEEHVKIFTALKCGKGDVENHVDYINNLISQCDLSPKQHALSKTLSGGQKRKLQMAIMLSGGSNVCCIDEVSSGIDPLARRKIWEVLLAERGRRTILLTTHFLDEADALADHIALLSKGILQVQGSAAELKNAHGKGYKIFLDRSIGQVPLVTTAGVLQTSDAGQIVFQLRGSQDVAELSTELEKQGLFNYRVQGPTIEDVFLELSAEVKDASAELQIRPDSDEVEKLNITTGKGTTFLRQIPILMWKRALVLRRNYMPYTAAIIVPIIAAALTTLFLTRPSDSGDPPFRDVYPNGVPCGASGGARPPSVGSSVSAFSLPDYVFGPPDRLTDQLRPFFPTSQAPVQFVTTENAFIDEIRTNQSFEFFGGFFNAETDPLFAYSLDSGAGTAQASSRSLSIANNILSGVRINAALGNFPNDSGVPIIQTVQAILYLGLAMCIYPGFFALYPTMERLSKVRALHYSNGIRSYPIWCAYALFDGLFVLVISILVTVIWASVYSGYFGMGYVFVVILLYGLTSAALAYCVSLAATSQLSAYALSAGIQVVIFLLSFLGVILSSANASSIGLKSLLDTQYFTIALISPSTSLLRALLLSLNQFNVACRRNVKATYPGAIDLYGGPILYLIVQLALLVLLLAYWEAGGRFGLRRGRKDAGIEGDSEAKSIWMEDAEHLATSNDGLRVTNLTKCFGSNVAVDDVTFGVKRGETFALLGPNGAGKSTAISLIRGDIAPSTRSGNIHIAGISLFSQPVQARNNLGICPQFDAVEPNLTVKEHLMFYAKARGVPTPLENTLTIAGHLGLDGYLSRQAVRLSGGNKRKLSLAIALVGNPTVLMLDEPSSGMDVAAKRAMWGILSSLAKMDKALVITTHSMEEADALCQRAGIMAGRMLALGETETLRKQHGDVLHIQLIHEEAPHTSADSTAAIRQWVDSAIPGAQIESGTYHGQVRFSVGIQGLQGLILAGEWPSRIRFGTSRLSRQPTSLLFELLESQKGELGLAYYTISPATMDQVFLNVVTAHQVKEENYESQVTRGPWVKRLPFSRRR